MSVESTMTVGRTLDWRWLCRAVVGGVFIWAALAKISDISGFAMEIHNYRMLPVAFENMAAMTMVWIELIAGLAVVLNLAPRSGNWILIGLLILFMVAIGQAIARGLDIDCGCFGTSDATRVGWIAMGRDIVLLALAWIGHPRSRAAA